MLHTQVEEFYRKASTSRGRMPDDDQSDKWVEVLANYATPQLDAALRRWDCDTTLETWEHGERYPRGRRMPTPAELKLSIDQFEAAERGARSGKFVSCGNCERGWVQVFEGKTVAGNPVDPKVGAVKRCVCWLQYIQRVKGAAA